MLNLNKNETHEMGKYKGWDIKSLINKNTQEIKYLAYFEKSPRAGVIWLDAKTPEELKEKIDKTKLRKGAF